MVYGYVDSADIRELSRLVFEDEVPLTPDPIAGVDYAHWQAHPLVLALGGRHSDGPAGALAYLAEGEESDAGAVVRWMTDGGFKGLFNNIGDFAESQFKSAFERHYGRWGDSQKVGFPSVTLSDMQPWDAIGESLEHEEPQRFYSIATGAGVYVYDLFIDIGKFRSE